MQRADITRSLQHKHELIEKAKSQNALLESLNALDDSKRLSPVSDTVDVLAEPSAALPLWRRVDRRFWWNEWLSKPLVDQGVIRARLSKSCCVILTVSGSTASSICLANHARLLPDILIRHSSRTGCF